MLIARHSVGAHGCGSYRSICATGRSFGMILYELESRKVPFEEIERNWDVREVSLRGDRPVPSAACPPEYAELMQRCWAQVVTVRGSRGEGWTRGWAGGRAGSKLLGRMLWVRARGFPVVILQSFVTCVMRFTVPARKAVFPPCRSRTCVWTRAWQDPSGRPAFSEVVARLAGM